jgi:hypothetical protein
MFDLAPICGVAASPPTPMPLLMGLFFMPKMLGTLRKKLALQRVPQPADAMRDCLRRIRMWSLLESTHNQPTMCFTYYKIHYSIYSV